MLICIINEKSNNNDLIYINNIIITTTTKPTNMSLFYLNEIHEQNYNRKIKFK